MSEAPVLVIMNARGLLLVESDNSFSTKYPSRTVTAIIDGFPSIAFILVVAGASSAEVHLQKHQIVASTSRPPSEFFHDKSGEPSAFSRAPQVDTVSAVHYKPGPDRLHQMQDHETVTKTDKEQLKEALGRRAECQ